MDIRIYTLFFMFIFCSSSKGQNKTDLPIGNIKSETKDVISSHGPEIITRTIKQDRKGNIWIAAFDGVFRYDGNFFTNITSKVSSARFFSVLEDRKGNIWTSSQSANGRGWVLSRYDEKSLSNKKPTVTEIESKYEDNKGMIFGILEAYDGTIWFGALDGVYR